MLSLTQPPSSTTAATQWVGPRGWIDYAFTDSVFGRIESGYTNLATAGFLNVATNSAEAPNHVRVNDLRAGLAYKFAGGL